MTWRVWLVPFRFSLKIAFECRPLLRRVARDFRARQREGGRADEVYVAYTDFINVLHQVPMNRRILPIEEAEIHTEGPRAVYLYEPTPEEILNSVLPRFVEVQVYQALLESIASEQAARMVAMRNATDAANDLISSLTLLRNKVRQASITKEMLDIAGGAEAARKAQATR